MAEKCLVPADMKQCQAEIPNGVNFMTCGGRFERVRCKKRPSWIATEKAAGKDGQIGSMSLCTSCKKVFLKQMGDIAEFTRILRPKQKDKAHEQPG